MEAMVTEKGFSLKSFFAAMRVLTKRGRGHDVLVVGRIRENRMGGGG